MHKHTALLTAVLLATTPAHAEELSFEIYKVGKAKTHLVAIVPFFDSVTNIINEHLGATDYPSTSQNLPDNPKTAAQVLQNIGAWQAAGFDYVVVASLNNNAIVYDVVDIKTGRTLGNTKQQAVDAGAQGLRFSAHVVADKIHEAISGEKGDFTSKIAFVEESGNGKTKISSLKVMDADGQNVRTIFSHQGAIFSPNFSPDGTRIAYSAQKPNGLPVIYVQNIQGGGASLVTPFRGHNLGPSFSPDGTSIVFSGSHENNNPTIYELHLPSGQLKPLTAHMEGAENSPYFAPDGRSVIFTADLGSRSQKLYRYSYDTKQTTAIGGQAASPRYSPDGQKIVYSAGSSLQVTGNVSRSISGVATHESASFSPTSTRLAYASNNNTITITSLQSNQSISKKMSGRIKDVAWSPRTH